MLARRLRPKARPNNAASERAIAELVTVTQSMRPPSSAATTSASARVVSTVE